MIESIVHTYKQHTKSCFAYPAMSIWENTDIIRHIACFMLAQPLRMLLHRNLTCILHLARDLSLQRT